MLGILKTKQPHADYSKSAMETETISKNEARPKSLVSRNNFLVISCFALSSLFIGLTVAGCKKQTSCDDEKEKYNAAKVAIQTAESDFAGGCNSCFSNAKLIDSLGLDNGLLQISLNAEKPETVKDSLLTYVRAGKKLLSAFIENNRNTELPVKLIPVSLKQMVGDGEKAMEAYSKISENTALANECKILWDECENSK